jgi:hypothetical protein
MMSAPASKALSNSRPGIFEWTGLQFLRPAARQTAQLIVPHLSLEAPYPLSLPLAEELPNDAASLAEIGSFIGHFDPTRHFREHWGERYRFDIETLWNNCVSAYRGSRDAIAPCGELLLCLAYDWRLGPCLGVAEHEKLSFLRWLIAQMRVRLSSSNRVGRFPNP